MKIPKIIHYCWFGRKDLPCYVKKYMVSWEKCCPDFEIRRWDESCIDRFDNNFLKQAVELNKWAFVSDFIRLMALQEFGGVYLDTDVELIKSPVEFMDNDIFLGFERHNSISTAIIGSVPEHPFIKELSNEYFTRSLLLPNGDIDYTPNVVYFTHALIKRGMTTNGSRQTIDGIAIYPCDFFSPKSLDTGKLHMTENTCAIHHFSASWLPLKKRINMRIAQIIGPRASKFIKKVKSKNDHK